MALDNIQSVVWVKDLIKTDENAYMLMTEKDGKVFSVPVDSANRHYQAIQEWVAEGNTIEEAD